MPVPSGLGSPQSVLDASIHACQKQIAGSDFLKRALVCISLGLLFVLALVVADHTWPGGLPRALASGAFLLGACAVVAVLLVCALLVVFRRLNPLFAAQQLEQSLGVTHNTVINAMLLRARKDAAQVVNAVTRQAAMDVAAADPIHGVGTPDRRPRILLAVTCGLWLLYALLAPKSVLQSIGRLFGSVAPAPTVTQLELLEPAPGDVVYAGEPLTIRVRVAGRVPDEVTFFVAPPVVGPDAPPIRYEMKPESSSDRGSIRQLVLAPSEVTDDIHYTCRAGDASLLGSIIVQPQPDILGFVIHLAPPDYVGREPETVDEPDLLVWPGTQATISVQANVEVRNPVFVLEGDGESRTRMRVDPSRPRWMSVSRRLMRSGRYRIEFADQWGYALRHAGWHQITVRGDAPPEVQIDQPARGEIPDDVIDLTLHPQIVASASDDVGVATIDFVLQIGNGEPTRTPAAIAAGAAQRRLSARLDAELIPLAEGQTATAWFEARDARVLPDGAAAPQTTRSRVITLTRSAEPPMIQPEPAQGKRGGESASSGSDQMDEEIPGQADSGDGDGDGESDTPERNSGEDGQSASAEDSQADPENREQKFVEQHAEELRQIGEAMQRRGNGAPSDGEPDGPNDRQPPPESADESDASSESGTSGHDGERDGSSQGDAGESPAGSDGEQNQPRPADEPAEGSEQPKADAESKKDSSPPRSEQSQGDSAERDSGKGDSPEDKMGSQDSQPSQTDSSEEGRDEGTAEPAQQSSQGQPGSDGERDEQPDQQSQGDQPGESRSPEKNTDQRGDPNQDGSDSAEQSGQSKPGQSETPPQDGTESDSDADQQQESGSESAQDDKMSGEGQDGADGKSRAESDQQAGGEQDPEGGDAAGESGQSTADGNPGQQAGETPGSGGGERPGDDEQLTEGGDLDPADPEDRPPAARGPNLESKGEIETRDVLEMLRRRGEIPQDVLDKLGWSRAKAAAFTRELQRLVNLQREAGAPGTPQRRKINSQIGDRRLRRGQGMADDASSRAHQDRNRGDELGKLTPPPDQRISPRLRRMLDAYYRSMAQQRETRAAEKTDSP